MLCGVPRTTILSIPKVKTVTLATIYGICEGLAITLKEFFDSPLFDRENITDWISDIIFIDSSAALGMTELYNSEWQSSAAHNDGKKIVIASVAKQSQPRELLLPYGIASSLSLLAMTGNTLYSQWRWWYLYVIASVRSTRGNLILFVSLSLRAKQSRQSAIFPFA